MKKKIVFILVVLSLLFITNQVYAKKIDSKYFLGTITDKNGDQVDKIIVPGRPPKDFRMPVAEPTDAAVTISNVPAFDWSYGCSATSAAMMAGHYDNAGYTNMYAGPTNGGVCPMNNSTWGAGECPLSATHMGYDGLGVKGHVDDFWVSYLSGVPDPYITGSWTPHTYADCTGDYMGTNQSALGSDDGSTTFYFGPDGSPLYDYTGCEPAEKDGCHGLRQFFESRGYTVTSNYSQYIIEHGLTYGFSLAQYQAEIDAGRPVLIQLEGHTMLGYGYDDSSTTIYIHDTWDYSDHSMTWGGSYSGMDQYGVGVFVLAPISGPPGAPSNPSPSDAATGISIDTMISWTNGANTDDVDVYFSSSQLDVTNKVGTALLYSGTAITSTDPNPSGSLDSDTPYYWRVVCKNSVRAETDGPVWSFTTESAGGTPATLSYHNSAAYFWNCPDTYGDDEFGVRFSPADACDLDGTSMQFYNTVGAPTGITVHVYDVDYVTNASGLPNVELGSLPVGIANINFYPTWTDIDLSSLGLSFVNGDEFFITYTVDGAVGDTLSILSDNGSSAAYRSVENWNGTWGYMLDDWGGDYQFLMTADITYATAPPPNLVINPSSVDFQQTASGGWKTQTITLQNAGGGQVVVSAVSIAGDSQIELYDYNTYPDTLFSNESINIMVAYGPDAVVTNNATVTVSETSSTRTDHFIPITGEGYYHNSWASGTPIFDQSPTGNQGDYGWSMSTSDAAPGYLHAENFWGLAEPIKAVEFWGINWYNDGSWHASDVEDPMTFEIKFYTDHATEYHPDVEVASFSIPLSRTTVDTVTFSSEPVYMYHAELPIEVVLTDGWVSIQGTSVSSPIDPWFLWSESPIGDHADVTYDSVNLEWDFDEIDQAFALYTTTVPPDPPVVAIDIINAGTDVELTWDPVTGANSYNVYSSLDPYGTFTIEPTGTAIPGTSWSESTSEKRFYYVTADTGTRDTFVPAAAPVLRKINTIRSIKDSKLTDGNELKK